MTTQNIAYFTGRLLPASETFIRAQAESLKTFNPYYVGTRYVPGLSLSKEKIFAVNSSNLIGSAQELIFKLSGIAPHLVRHLRQLEISLIHAHFGVCGALALPISNALNLPLIVTFYGLDATMTDEYANRESISTRVYVKRRESLKKSTSLFIGVSDFIRDRLVAQGFPAERVISHYYGVDTREFSPDSAIEREPIVLFVGRFVEKKGCEYLIKAMASVQSVLPHVSLILIGDGGEREKLEKMASQLLKQYQFVGFQHSHVVKQWMNRASLLAVPSITASNGDSEGLPTVVVEAQAMGLPVIGSRHAGIPQAVIHGETGFLAEERDWKSLSELIVLALQNKELLGNLSHQAREHVVRKFDLNKQTGVLEFMYENLIEKFKSAKTK
jgi:colanic acid/amylovoran biosynthesis glycosyltransferase